MRHYPLRFLLVFCLWGWVFPSAVFPARDTGRIIQRLDRNYYYLQARGVRKLTARIDLEQLDVSSGVNRYLKQPSVIFQWRRDQGRPSASFRIADPGEQGSPAKENEILQFFENYQELIIPRTLKDRFSEYIPKIRASKKNKLVMELQSGGNREKIRTYNLVIDPRRWVIRKMRLVQDHAPEHVVVTLRHLYLEKEKKWLLEESRASFKLNGEPFREITKFYYQRKQNLWLVKKVIQTVIKEDAIIQEYLFRVRDVQVE